MDAGIIGWHDKNSKISANLKTLPIWQGVAMHGYLMEAEGGNQSRQGQIIWQYYHLG